MKSRAIYVIVAFLCCSSCIYKGNLKENFFAASNGTGKLPLKAYLLFDNTIENSVYRARNIYGWHGVDIETKPGLRAAMEAAFQSTFDTVYTSNHIDTTLINNFDVIIIPTIELADRVITISATLKKVASDNVINIYRSSTKIYHWVQTSTSQEAFGEIVAEIPFVNAIAAPFVVAGYTQIVGAQSEKDLEAALCRSLWAITDDIGKDRLLLERFGKLN